MEERTKVDTNRLVLLNQSSVTGEVSTPLYETPNVAHEVENVT
jgi:hypothetical protein